MEATQNTITEPEKQALTTIDNEDKTTIQPKDVCHLSIILIQEFADLKSKEEEYKKMLETDIEESKFDQIYNELQIKMNKMMLMRDQYSLRMLITVLSLQNLKITLKNVEKSKE